MPDTADHPADRTIVGHAPPPALLLTTGFLWVLAPLWYVLAEALSASAFPGYSYAANYISDLGVPDPGTLQGRSLDSPLHAVMNAGFIGEGLLFLLGMIVLLGVLRRRGAALVFVALGLMHVLGITLVGLVSGSAANAESGLMIWHGLGAVLAIAGGNLAAMFSVLALTPGHTMRWAGPTLGLVGLLSAALLVTGVGFPDGLEERGAVYTFMLWQLLAGVRLLRAGLRSAPPLPRPSPEALPG